MLRNWKLICQEKNQLLKLLLCVTNEDRICAGLQKGFPEFFTGEEQQPRVPLSAIKAWKEDGKEEPPLPESVLRHFGVPHFEFGSAVGVTYPTEWDDLLSGQNISINGAGDGVFDPLLEIQWHGTPCFVADYSEPEFMILVPKQFVDTKA